MFKPIYKPPGSLSQGLLSWYNMDEGGGSIITDACGRLNLRNSVAGEWTNLDKTMYVHTNGEYCGASVTAGSPLDITTNKISFGGWIYPIASNIYQVICGNIFDQSTRQYAMYLSASGTGFIFYSLNGVFANQNVVVNKAWSVNQWNLIMLTYDGATITIYINGYNAYSVAKTGNITTVANSKFQIGAEGVPSVGYYRCTGGLGPMGVWNRPLTHTEIWQLFTTTNPRNKIIH